MIARVLIVVLAMLNLGAALWWGLHRPAAADAATALPPGVARLQLWREVSAQAPMLPAEPEAEPEAEPKTEEEESPLYPDAEDEQDYVKAFENAVYQKPEDSDTDAPEIKF